MNKNLCVGLMSGTSMDGIDIALIDTNGKDFSQSIAHQFYPYPLVFQQAMKKLEQSVNHHKGDLKQSAQDFKGRIQQLNQSELIHLLQSFQLAEINLNNLILLSTKFHEQAVQSFLADQHLLADQIKVIGYHGQTVYHAPHQGVTLQVGNAAYLAEQTQIPVVSQFRLNDIKEGGQGAPLAPLYHWALAMQTGIMPLTIINCGGIANITFINSETPEDLVAFDTGPGNVLLDRIVRERTEGKMQYDQDGRLALQGKVHSAALKKLYAECLPSGFLERTPPKSLDSYDCQIPAIFGDLSLPDACATLAEFTVACIVNALKFTPQRPKCMVLVGGGWHNPAIANALSRHLSVDFTEAPQVCSARMMGWHPAAIEAEAFAYLAERTMLGLPISFPGTTGVPQPLTGGEIFYP